MNVAIGLKSPIIAFLAPQLAVSSEENEAFSLALSDPQSFAAKAVIPVPAKPSRIRAPGLV